MNKRQIRWERGEGRYYFGYAKLRNSVALVFCIIPRPGKYGWNGCRLLYNWTRGHDIILKYIQGNSLQSCKMKAGVMLALMWNGSVDFSRLTFCRQVTKFNGIYWTDLEREEWIQDTARWHPAFKEYRSKDA